MQRSGRILILLGFILAIMAAAASLYAINASTRTAPPVALKKVVVAQQNIAQYARIDAALLTTMDWPEDAVPPEALSDPAPVIGKLAAANIVRGQLIMPSMAIDKSVDDKGKVAASTAAIALADDKVAVAFPIDQISGIASALREGDRVDLLVSYELPAPPAPAQGSAQTASAVKKRITQATLQDVQVIRVGQWTQVNATDGAPVSGKEASSVTLAVSLQDALVLKFLRETAVEVQFALRPAGNHRIVTTQPVVIEYVDQRFNFAGTLR